MTLFPLDRHAHLDSILHRIDPRSKIAGLLLPVLLISSTPRGHLKPFPYYFGAALMLVALSRVPPRYIAWRCVAGLPFVMMATALLLLTGAPDSTGQALSVVLKALAAILLITLLTATSRLHELLWAMRRLGAPHVLNLIVNLMHRYVLLLFEEYRRMARARESRTVRKARFSDIGLYGNQFGLLFIRSWERAERVQAAMLSRGFTGSLPNVGAQRPKFVDVAFPTISIGLFAAARWI